MKAAPESRRVGLERAMLYSELEEVVGPEHIAWGEAEKLVYSTDWFWLPQMWLDRGEKLRAPDYIVHPGTVAEISEILRVANSYRTPVIPWGGGSGSQGGAVPLFGGIILDTKRLNRILEIDETSLTVTAEAGINGTQLEWALNEKNLTLPHYPASANCATLGGYLAPRGSGTVSTKYGKAEDLVLGLQIVLPTGEVIRTPVVPKHAAGPDFFHLFLGSEGTLGVITEATMQVVPVPEVRLFRALLFDELGKGLEAGRRIVTSRLEPSVVRLYDQASTKTQVKRVLGYEYDGVYMVLGFDGDADIAALQEQKALAICAELGAKDLGRDPGDAWWRHRYDFYYPPKSLHLPWMYGTTETVSTYRDIEKLYWAQKEALETGYQEWNLEFIAHFSHWFPWGAMFYSRFIVREPPQDAQEALLLHNRIWNTAMTAVLENGGMVNEHHGVGLKLSRFMRRQYGDAWPLLETLKHTLDPNGVMNPGKVGFGRGRS